MASGPQRSDLRGHGALALAAIALVIAALASVPALGLAAGGIAPHEGVSAQTGPEADAISLRADVAADGSATWQVTYRIELDGANETAAFEDLRADIERDPAPYVDRFRDRMVRTANAAENATGRAMAVENVSVSANRDSLPQGEYGVISYRLDWRGFAAIDGDRLRAGDAIDQFFLDERTSLTVAWPAAYGLESVAPEPTATDERSVTWQGRRDFGPGEPRVEVVRGAAGGDGASGGGLPLVPLGLVAALILAAGGLLYVWRGSQGEDPAPGASADPTAGGGGGGAEPGGEAATGDTDDGPPPDLLSNEERVLQLLEDNGGRLKQQQVAGQLDWTDAKTSQVVGDLRDEGQVESFRLGRENVLTLPDVSLEPERDDETE